MRRGCTLTRSRRRPHTDFTQGGKTGSREWELTKKYSQREQERGFSCGGVEAARVTSAPLGTPPDIGHSLPSIRESLSLSLTLWCVYGRRRSDCFFQKAFSHCSIHRGSACPHRPFIPPSAYTQESHSLSISTLISSISSIVIHATLYTIYTYVYIGETTGPSLSSFIRVVWGEAFLFFNLPLAACAPKPTPLVYICTICNSVNVKSSTARRVERIGGVYVVTRALLMVARHRGVTFTAEKPIDSTPPYSPSSRPSIYKALALSLSLTISLYPISLISHPSPISFTILSAHFNYCNVF